MLKEQLQPLKDAMRKASKDKPKTKQKKLVLNQTRTQSSVIKKRKFLFDEPLALIGRPKSSVTSAPPVGKSVPKINVDIEQYKRPGREACELMLNVSRYQNLEFVAESKLSLSPRKTQELVIGLDFGTAYTKVIIGELTYAYPISFDDHGYLLPSEIFMDQDGECTLSNYLDGIRFKELKLPLLLDNTTKPDMILIIAFFALIFCQCRRWSESSIYKDTNIDWLVNAGLPTESYHDEKLSGSYKVIISAAWILSFCREVSIQNASLVMETLELSSNSIPDKFQLSPELISLFPEFAAQIVGYVQSPSRREYSHLLVDIGAGTLDVAMFIVSNEDGEWLFQTTGKDISTLGADILAKHRVMRANKKVEIDFSTCYPNEEQFANTLEISLDDLSIIDKPFFTAVNASIKDVVISIKGGDKFGSDITTFICGGGRNVGLYNKAIDVVKRDFPLKILTLPIPERLRAEGVEIEDYHRLSVAYGLSYDPFNIGSTIKKYVKRKPIFHSEFEPSNYGMCPK
tara:strand:+ start:3702 stop:5246 length:1545 start_codon:yes stop_codon:yes gene_type:complete